jgi:hypothetical protein
MYRLAVMPGVDHVSPDEGIAPCTAEPPVAEPLAEQTRDFQLTESNTTHFPSP